MRIRWHCSRLAMRPTWALSLGLLTALLILAQGCSDATGPAAWERGDILDRLNGLPGVEAVEIQPYYGYPRAFRLDISQPVDHYRPNGMTFTQRAYLSHIADSITMVFAPSGYGTTPESGQELAATLQSRLAIPDRMASRPGSSPDRGATRADL
jgi:hypothetical protein